MSSQTHSKINTQKVSKSRLETVDFNHLKFGEICTDHMLSAVYENNQWSEPEILPFQPLQLNPSAKIFHYGQSIFEGMKAYKDVSGDIWMFRPEENFKRMNISAKRLAMPEIPRHHFMDGLCALLNLDHQWIPTAEGSSLYIRPFMFACGEGFHASPANAYQFIISCSPSGPYFSGKIKVRIEEKYARAANGGVGFAKAGGNYAAQFYPTSLAQQKGYQQVIWTDDNTHEYIEEAGAMNIFVRIDDTLLTSPVSDRILDGVTRKSIIDIARHEGIDVEVRKITVSELVEAARDNRLKEMFGAGTAAVISPIAGFGYKDMDFDIPPVEDAFATRLKKSITDIQTNRAPDPFGWRYKV